MDIDNYELRQLLCDLRDASNELQGWFGRFAGELTPGGLPVNKTGNAYVNALVVKSGSGTLWGFSGYNSNTAAQFVQVHDANSVPADGQIPKILLAVPPSSNFSVDFGQRGRAFSQGIVICNSSTGATKTIGSADCWFDVQYE